MSVSGVGSSSNAANSTTALASASNQFVSEQTFLKLLVTQLQNQDPMNPQDASQFVAELASFSSVEQLTALSTSMNSVLESSVTNLIGKTVTVADSTNAQGYVQGPVSAIVYYANGPAVDVSGKTYPISAIQNVQ
ncbi:MAG TPA: flagellar hook capping FlgD N-terminal domain-containing protein [bacterium]|nr:flagellar hook capping FlgD N-terminal domain-containing protein [bacterium]